MKSFVVSVFASAFFFAAPAAAQWKGEAGLGVVSASGNTDASSISGNIGMSKKTGVWRHNIFGDVYKAEADGVDSADRASLGYKADRDITDRIYGWGSLRLDQDEFADIDRRIAGLVGVGHHTLLGPVHTLDLEAGVGYRTTKFISAIDDSKEAVFGLAAIYSGKLTDTLTLTQRLSLEAGKDNKLLESITGLNVKLAGNFSLTLAHILRRNSDIVGAKGKKTDNLTTVNLVYSF